MTNSRVRPPVEPLTEEDARHLLAQGLNRPVFEQGPKRFALKVGCDERTIRKARDEETTLRLDNAFNTLLADGHCLDPLARHFRKLLIDLDPEGGDDMATISAMLLAAHEYVERMRDGKRCHGDTLALGKLFRPLLPALGAIVHQADELLIGPRERAA